MFAGLFNHEINDLDNSLGKISEQCVKEELYDVGDEWFTMVNYDIIPNVRQEPRKLEPEIEESDDIESKDEDETSETEDIKQEEVDIKDELIENTNKKKTGRKRKRNDVEEQQFECYDCGFKTTKKPTLKAHIKFHSKVKPFECMVCHYKTVDKSNLKSHMKVHTGEKSHHCAYCDFKTTSKYFLMQHESVHTGTKLFKCEFCTFQTHWRSTLTAHTIIHTVPEDFYQCSECEYKCQNIQKMRKHRVVHQADMPFQCPRCSFKGKIKRAVKRHFRRRHMREVIGFNKKGEIVVKNGVGVISTFSLQHLPKDFNCYAKNEKFLPEIKKRLKEMALKYTTFLDNQMNPIAPTTNPLRQSSAYFANGESMQQIAHLPSNQQRRNEEISTTLPVSICSYNNGQNTIQHRRNMEQIRTLPQAMVFPNNGRCSIQQGNTTQISNVIPRSAYFPNNERDLIQQGNSREQIQPILPPTDPFSNNGRLMQHAITKQILDAVPTPCLANVGRSIVQQGRIMEQNQTSMPQTAPNSGMQLDHLQLAAAPSPCPYFPNNGQDLLQQRKTMGHLASTFPPYPHFNGQNLLQQRKNMEQVALASTATSISQTAPMLNIQRQFNHQQRRNMEQIASTRPPYPYSTSNEQNLLQLRKNTEQVAPVLKLYNNGTHLTQNGYMIQSSRDLPPPAYFPRNVGNITQPWKTPEQIVLSESAHFPSDGKNGIQRETNMERVATELAPSPHFLSNGTNLIPPPLEFPSNRRTVIVRNNTEQIAPPLTTNLIQQQSVKAHFLSTGRNLIPPPSQFPSNRRTVIERNDMQQIAPPLTTNLIQQQSMKDGRGLDKQRENSKPDACSTNAHFYSNGGTSKTIETMLQKISRFHATGSLNQQGRNLKQHEKNLDQHKSNLIRQARNMEQTRVSLQNFISHTTLPGHVSRNGNDSVPYGKRLEQFATLSPTAECSKSMQQRTAALPSTMQIPSNRRHLTCQAKNMECILNEIPVSVHCIDLT